MCVCDFVGGFFSALGSSFIFSHYSDVCARNNINAVSASFFSSLNLTGGIPINYGFVGEIGMRLALSPNWCPPREGKIESISSICCVLLLISL